jgi:hypothetical protein
VTYALVMFFADAEQAAVLLNELREKCSTRPIQTRLVRSDELEITPK